MPLPKALAARLAKRGLIKVPPQDKEPELDVINDVQEEIIAEDYDESPQDGTPIAPPPPPPEKFDKYQGWYSCPNKWNVYHECTPACQEQWKEIKELDKDYNKKRVKMLIKYPLPTHWQEILDIGLSRYYYWNTETDLVAWLPPGHPKCRVSVAAAQLRKQMVEEREKRLKEEGDDKKETDEEDSSEDEKVGSKKRKKLSAKEKAESDESSAESVEDGKPPKKEKRREKRDKVRDRDRDREKDRERDKEKEKEKEKERDRRERDSKDRRGKERSREKRGTKKKEDSDALDPMDPAAYSDVPRGTWASGLPDKNEAKTGVDSTATGPLFQMRPYPNPGSVLRANAAANNTVGPKKPA